MARVTVALTLTPQVWEKVVESSLLNVCEASAICKAIKKWPIWRGAPAWELSVRWADASEEMKHAASRGYYYCLVSSAEELREVTTDPKYRETNIEDVGVEIAFKKNFSLGALAALRNLRYLHMRPFHSSVCDLQKLDKCAQLEILNISYSFVKHLGGLQGCPKLTELVAYRSLVEDITALENCAALETLYLDECPHLESLAALTNCPRLKCLGVSCTKVTDLAPLAGLPLAFLNINATPVSDLSPLTSSMLSCKLVTIRACGTNVANIRPLFDIPTLKDVLFNEAPIAKSESGLAEIEALKMHIADRN